MSTTVRKNHSETAFSDPNWGSPEIIYGSNLISDATKTDEKYVVVTMEIPWDLVKNDVTKPPTQVVYVPDMHLETLKGIERSIPDDIEMVIGVGGGSSHDCAKYVALKKQVRLVQFPTIFGGDAVVTSAVGIRDERRVKYIGHIYTDKVYVDFNIIRKAPPVFVRYGAADILSSYTSLLDWKLAVDRGKERYNEEIATYAEESLLGKLRSRADDVRNLTDEGIKTIVDLYVEYHRIAHKISTDRPQEGSEHFVAYNAEYITRRTYVHGALLSLGIWVIAGFFYHQRENIEEFLDSLGLEYSLASAGLSEEEFKQTVTTLNTFTLNGGYYYSVVNELEPTEALVNEMIKRARR
jgi:glycerol-1-phosphate dehydrogenase [NAD(P)+]